MKAVAHIALALFSGLLVVMLTPQGLKAASPLFGYSETPHKDLKPFPKWTGVLEKYFAGQKKEENCTKGSFKKCNWAEWGEMLSVAEKQKPFDQLTTVNKFMNKHKYVVDPINWGTKDYWALPEEFRKKYGDCEDYSIAKYMSLRALGWKPDDMRVVVLRDMNLKAMHAVLAVKFNNKNYILDNQISIVAEDKRIRHYQPIFSVSENGWWRHRNAGAAPQKKKLTALQKALAKKKDSAAQGK